MVDTALDAIDHLTGLVDPLRARLQRIGRGHPGLRALRPHYGVGALSAAIIWAELGDCRRFSSSDQAVRFAGLDVTVYSSDNKRSPGHLARQGSPELRWALFEAAKSAARAQLARPRLLPPVRDRLGMASARPCRWPASWPVAATTP